MSTFLLNRSRIKKYNALGNARHFQWCDAGAMSLEVFKYIEVSSF